MRSVTPVAPLVGQAVAVVLTKRTEGNQPVRPRLVAWCVPTSLVDYNLPQAPVGTEVPC